MSIVIHQNQKNTQKPIGKASSQYEVFKRQNMSNLSTKQTTHAHFIYYSYFLPGQTNIIDRAIAYKIIEHEAKCYKMFSGDIC